MSKSIANIAKHFGIILFALLQRVGGGYSHLPIIGDKGETASLALSESKKAAEQQLCDSSTP